MILRNITILAACVFVPTLSAKADWPLARGNAAQTAVIAGKIPDTLNELWRFQAKSAFESTPVIAEGKVFVGNFDKQFYAIDLKTGKELWKTEVGLVRASAAYRKGKLFVGNLDGKFVCLDAVTGKELWAFEAGGEISAAANFAGEYILIPSHDSTLYCLDQNGKKVWEFLTEGPVYGGVAVVGDRTYLAGCDSLLHTIDTKTGKELGSVDLKGQTGASAAIVEKTLYVGTMSNQVLAVDLEKMKILWEFEAPRRAQAFYASPAIDAGTLIIGSRDKNVWALDTKTGKPKWFYTTEHKVDGSAIIVGDRVVVGSLDQNLYVIERDTGKKVTSLELDGAILGSPAFSDGKLLITTEKGTVYCFGAK